MKTGFLSVSVFAAFLFIGVSNTSFSQYDPSTGIKIETTVSEFQKFVGDETYDNDGYDQYGYDKYGYNMEGYDRSGYNRNGYDRSGYESDGYDVNGYNKNGYDRKGNYRNTNEESVKVHHDNDGSTNK